MNIQEFTACFDLETTGTDTVTDRIVQIAAWKLDKNLSEAFPIKAMLINPGRPIPPEATAVHKITDEMVKDAPTFPQIAKAFHEFLSDCNLAGFNILNFDVPLLSEEFARCNIIWPAEGTVFLDAYKIFALKEKRDLAGAAKFYLNASHEDAHDAGADVVMTRDVLVAQLLKYNEDFPDLESVHKFCVGNMVDIAGKLIRLDDEAGTIVYNFGKDKGKGVKANPGFANWMLNQSFPTETKQIIRKIFSNVYL